MAKYRQLYTEFWSDSFILELTTEEKLFYLYLISNSKTTQCSIFELSNKIISIETGINIEIVEKLLIKFCEYNKILYCKDTKEIMVLNWMKYNIPNNINAIKCVRNELNKIKCKTFLKILFNKCYASQLDVDKIFENLNIEEPFISPSADNISSENNSNVICTKIKNPKIQATNNSEKPEEIEEPSDCLIDKPITSSLQGACQPLPSNRIRSNKQEVRNKKQELINKEEEEVLTKKETLTKKKSITSELEIAKETAEIIKQEDNSAADGYDLNSIIKIFEENVHAITPLVYKKILYFTTHVSNKVIIMAIHEAVNYNAKTIKYITKILNNWISKGIKTAEQVIDYQKQWANRNMKEKVNNVKSGGFCDYEQRIYDIDALEKQLLGIA
ncbi:DnaD domain protein [Clostridium algoriphilum]|uniref:DnaD domain-containing protein n=1 Tax=Clostridium algoriphilum TaxID=198347 RepID=UPI001CF2BBE7|nr:DnaD domain protein [Clostridium algoriphilum]MCB2295330.1 DnaD domain protein [Clostridium algoriphilum]